MRTISRASQPVNYRIAMMQHWAGAIVPAVLGIIIYRKTAAPGRRGGA